MTFVHTTRQLMSGATPSALAAYERALAQFQNWGNPGIHVACAIAEAPDFVLGHVLQAYLHVGGRDPHRIRAARAIHDRAIALGPNVHERMHLAAIHDVISGDYARATIHLDALLEEHPRDVLALQAAQSFDYLTGETQRMLARVERAMQFWSTAAPGYEAVLAMHAFALEECAEYDRAAACALAVLEMDPSYLPAYHVMCHVFEMTDRSDAGIAWLADRMNVIGIDRLFTTHCWWHLALFHLTVGRADVALRLYDECIWQDHASISDLIDASALLWRIGLAGADIGARWMPLAAAWDRHIDDAFCSFSDMHAMLAFVGAQDWTRAARLERALLISQSQATRHGATTRQLGLPACQALASYGRGDHANAAVILARLPPLAHQFGGSHAQRDVLNTTLLATVQCLRRPKRLRSVIETTAAIS